ncbi:MAG TPA: hypothetical protein VHM70_13985 [Polyangiaceae bacterium]|nr:hypothetical protein [Polyangiaceae bacterium]
MLRKRIAGMCLLASSLALGATLSTASTAHAQGVIDLDDDEGDGAAAQGSGGGKAGAKGKGGKDAPAEQGPVTAGQMTEDAAAAKSLFDKQKWAEAALALHRVVAGETGDDPGNQQLAQYWLAISLYRLKFYQTSYAMFSTIAANKNHLKFGQTLLWLSKLATQLPEPAGIIDSVGRYGDEDLARFNNPQQRDLYYQLNYLLGRYKYHHDKGYEEAIRLFNRVKPSSRYYVQSQFFSGISYVQLRKSIPAVNAFQRIETALHEGVEGVEDERRMQDLAYLSQARTYYSASIKLDAETNAPSIDDKKLSAAVKYWNQIDVTSEYWLDALFEESWAYFMAGDYPRALGNIHTIEAPYFPGAFYPEAQILKAVIYFANCNYEAATTVVARFNKKYVPIRDELKKVLKDYEGEGKSEEFYKFLLQVQSGKADLPPAIKGIVEHSLSDRQLLRYIEYVKLLDKEKETYDKAPGSFRTAGLGGYIQDRLGEARQNAIKQAGELAKSRYRRFISELEEHLNNGEKILIDITAAQRNLLDEKLKAGQVSAAESKIYGVVNPDEEHVIWVFDGEFWRDELGFYRQVVQSACGR